jgi:hypothetical protein
MALCTWVPRTTRCMPSAFRETVLPVRSKAPLQPIPNRSGCVSTPSSRLPIEPDRYPWLVSILGSLLACGGPSHPNEPATGARSCELAHLALRLADATRVPRVAPRVAASDAAVEAGAELAFGALAGVSAERVLSAEDICPALQLVRLDTTYHQVEAVASVADLRRAVRLAAARGAPTLAARAHAPTGPPALPLVVGGSVRRKAGQNRGRPCDDARDADGAQHLTAGKLSLSVHPVPSLPRPQKAVARAYRPAAVLPIRTNWRRGHNPPGGRTHPEAPDRPQPTRPSLHPG